MKRLLLIASALLIALVLSVLSWLFTSESGLLWAYREAQSRLPGALSVDDISGRLSGLVKLEGVRYEDRDQTFKARQVTVDWDPWECKLPPPLVRGCPAKSRLCKPLSFLLGGFPVF